MEEPEREVVKFKKGVNGEKPDVKSFLLKRGFEVVGGPPEREQLRNSERGINATYVPGSGITTVTLSRDYGGDPTAYKMVAEELRAGHSDYVVR